MRYRIELLNGDPPFLYPDPERVMRKIATLRKRNIAVKVWDDEKDEELALDTLKPKAAPPSEA
jgi:hypothetical protein